MRRRDAEINRERERDVGRGREREGEIDREIMDLSVSGKL